jgi:hypothetical protein
MMIRIAILFCLLVAGCTDAPNALDLQLAPAQEAFALNEPILLKAKLVAKKGSVCLDRGNFIAVQVTHATWAEPASSRDWPIAREQFVGPVMYPITSLGDVLDVADSQDRYVIVEPGKPLERSIRLTPYRGGLTVQDLEAPTYPYRDWIRLPSPLASGRYRVVARLITETSFYFVHPMFWHPYNKPVVGETEIVIE